MRVKVTGPKISGAPDPGEIGEVDDELGEAMIRRGYAGSVESRSARLRDVAEPEEFTSEWRESPGTVTEPTAIEVPVGEVGEVEGDGSGEKLPPAKPKAAAKKKAAPKASASDTPSD